MKPLDWMRYVAPGLALAGVVAPVYARTYLTLEAAQKLCFPDATEFVPADVTLTPQQMQAIHKDSGVDVRSAQEKVWKARAGDRFLGWFIEDEVVGKHEFITWSLALDPTGGVLQVEILEYRETYGYQVNDETWRAQFHGVHHGAALKLDRDIKNISGATLSSRHIADGVRRLLSLHELVLKG